MDHVVSLVPELGDVVERVDHAFLYGSLQLHVNREHSTSTTNSSTAENWGIGKGSVKEVL